MSNKAKATTMKKNGEPQLKPRLRFQEFWDAGGWESSPLGSVCEILNNRRIPITSAKRVAGPYPYYGASGIVDFIGEYIFDERLLLVGEDGAKWDAFEKTAFIAEGKYWVNNHAHVLKPTGVNDTLLENYLTMADLGPFVTGAAPPKLTLGKLKVIPVPVPSLTDEQQKIADCLTSVDDLIAAQARKVDALMTHKKGLMQQLFPREGETQPRLRFPEFKDAGGWEVLPVSSVAHLKNGYAFKSSNYIESGRYTIITIANVQSGWLQLNSDRTISDLPDDIQAHQILQLGDILVSMTGNVGRVCRVSSTNLLLNQRVGKLVSSNIDRDFFYHSLQNPRFRSLMQLRAAGGAQGNLSAGDIGSYPLGRPSDTAEQQKIADCLTSVDDLIAAQAQKVDALKTHKKGLMQQLFPSPKDVDA